MENNQQLLQESAEEQERLQQQMRERANLPITLSLTVGETNTLLQVLGDGPFNTVAVLLNKIRSQAQQQISRQTQPEKGAQTLAREPLL